ncbi:nucleotidyltransferase domain-containing protein [Deinococcus sp. KSM4-11]|uniref:nucleotidyltransferase domain-containing protein n=1 Tax=Deinococcus sp. KSM4-11 TaxID=2568654 RepID=UPI0010A30E74|nr:nucleotidyltransferase domain-containing protein [Deinococcus sp. KSM4-11]THF87000.1 nucleotidyltransferase domain-containing protein [Deinococcus sp. KSM4-11]
MAIPDLASSVARRLLQIPGVQGVVLGGSYATGTATSTSDLDLGICYDHTAPLAMAALNALCADLDDSGVATASDPGGWGPWVNGGAWLTIQGRRVDIIYRELGRVAHSVQEAREGRVTLHVQMGHPHGIHGHQYAAELASCVILDDPTGRLEALRAQVSVYPPALSRSLEGAYGWAPAFWLGGADKGLGRGDLSYVQGCAFQAVMAMVQVICARAHLWLLNEKGAVERAARCPTAPQDFARRVNAAVAGMDLPALHQLAAEVARPRTDRDDSPATAASGE